MATTRKYWRRINVDGCLYRWMVCREEYYEQGFENEWRHSVVVENAITGSILRGRTESSPPNRVNYFPTAPVLPSAVARMIRKAKAEGWTEEKQKVPFAIWESEKPSHIRTLGNRPTSSR